jgi:hypothetical protein
MADPPLPRITDIAAALRDSIMLTPCEERPVGFRDFPVGSCGDTALLLGTLLSEAGFGEFNYVSAERVDKRERTWQSHGWVEQNSLIILKLSRKQDTKTDSLCKICRGARRADHRAKQMLDHFPGVFAIPGMHDGCLDDRAAGRD